MAAEALELTVVGVVPVAAAVVALGSLFYSASFVARHTDNIYLLDGNGGAASATVSSSTAI